MSGSGIDRGALGTDTCFSLTLPLIWLATPPADMLGDFLTPGKILLVVLVVVGYFVIAGFSRRWRR